jgi:organic hydroperoxide reductase OsmC/OhrA
VTDFALAAVFRVSLPESLLVEQAHAGCPYSKATRANIPVGSAEAVGWPAAAR